MSDNFVSNDQASGVGGNSKSAGAQADNTFQDNKIKQLVVLVRFKPKPAAAGFDTSAATSMLGGVTGAIEGAVSAAESAAASIPGLDMFIKEEKKDSSSEKEYKYFNDYSGWDNVFNKMNSGLKEMNPDNVTDTFEFNSDDADGRKNDAQQLLSKIKSKISGWSQYSANIHLIGLGQGGNVINECTSLLAKDGQFNSEKWCVKSVIYVATPLYKNQHVLDKACFKKQGGTFSFGNPYDLTQNAIEYFDKTDKLLKLIEDSNKNTLSLAVGKVKLRIIQVLSIVLSGLNLSIGDTSQLNKFDKIKNEITGMIDDVVGLVKKIISEGAAFVKLGDLPEFSKVTNGYGDIPNEAKGRLTKGIDDIMDKAGKQAKSANISLGPADLAGLLNCLCPLFDKVTASMSVFKYESKTGVDLAKQIIDQAWVSKVYAPLGSGGSTLQVDEEYSKKASQSTSDGKPDKSEMFIRTVQGMLSKASEKETDINSMSDEQKILVAEAIGCMVQPMLASKKKIYQKLLSLIPFDLNKMTQDYTADKLMGIPGGALQKIGIAFPEDLNKSVAGTDGEIKRITGYFDKNNFDTQEDSLYFIYNSHNLILKKMYGPIANCVDRQTGYFDYMKSKGYDNECTISENSYKQGSKETKSNVMPAQELPAATQ